MSTIKIGQITANNQSSNTISSILVYGTATTDCQSVRLEVFTADNATLLFSDIVIPSNNNNQSSDYDSQTTELDNLWQKEFFLSSDLQIKCNTNLFVKATVTNLNAISDQGVFSVSCKNQTQQPTNGGGNNGNTNWACLISSRIFTLLFLYCLVLFSQSAISNNITIFYQIPIILSSAILLFGLWLFFCNPSRCSILRLFCWLFMMATILTAGLSIYNISFVGLIITCIYGGIVASFIHFIKLRNCTIPVLQSFPI
jgi:hypothetical protein